MDFATVFSLTRHRDQVGVKARRGLLLQRHLPIQGIILHMMDEALLRISAISLGRGVPHGFGRAVW